MAKKPKGAAKACQGEAEAGVLKINQGEDVLAVFCFRYLRTASGNTKYLQSVQLTLTDACWEIC